MRVALALAAALALVAGMAWLLRRTTPGTGDREKARDNRSLSERIDAAIPKRRPARTPVFVSPAPALSVRITRGADGTTSLSEGDWSAPIEAAEQPTKPAAFEALRERIATRRAKEPDLHGAIQREGDVADLHVAWTIDAFLAAGVTEVTFQGR